MQVHEISRTALNELINSGKVDDWYQGYGDYAIVCCAAKFGASPAVICLQDYCDSEYWACRSAKNRQEISLANTVADGEYCCHYYEVWRIVDDNDWVMLWGYQNEEKSWTNSDGEHLQALFPDDRKALRFAYDAVAQNHCNRVVIDGIHGYYCVELGEECTGLIVQLEEKMRGKYDAHYEVKNASKFYNVSFVDTGCVKKKYICPECGYDCVVM